MALQRYYLPYNGTIKTPAPNALPWTVFPNSIAYDAVTVASALANQSNPAQGAAGDVSRLYNYLTPAVAQSTVYTGGVFRAALRCENWQGGTGNKILKAVVRRVNASNQIVGAPVASVESVPHPGSTITMTLSGPLSPVTLDAGDRLVVEFGGRFTATTAGQGLYIERGMTGADLPFVQGSTAAGKGWFELEWNYVSGSSRRYYLGKNIVPALSPPFSSWSASASAVRRQMSQIASEPSNAPGGSDPSEFIGVTFSKGGDGRQTTLGGQFVADDTLPAGPVKGKINFSIPVTGAMTFIDNRTVHRGVAKVVSNDGTVVRGVLYAGPGLPSSEDPMADNYWWHINESQWVHNAPLTEVVAQEGDRLVFEYGNDSSFDYSWPSFQFRIGAPAGRPDASHTVRASPFERPWVQFDLITDRPLYVGADKVKKLYLGSTEVPHLKLGALNGF